MLQRLNELDVLKLLEYRTQQLHSLEHAQLDCIGQKLRFKMVFRENQAYLRLYPQILS
jgi:hypothetical protein